MAADEKKGGSSSGTGSGRETSSRKSPLSGGSRKPVTIDLSAKDVSSTKKEGDDAAKKPAASAAAEKKSRSVPNAGTAQSAARKPATAKPAETPKGETAKKDTPKAAEKKPAAAASVTSADTKKVDEAKPATATAAKVGDTKAAGAAKPEAKETGKVAPAAAEPKKPAEDAKAAAGSAKTPADAAKADAKTSAKKDSTPPASGGGSGKGSGAGTPPPAAQPPQKKGGGFGSMLVAGIVGAAIVAGAGYGLNQAGVLQLAGADTEQKTNEMQALLETSQAQYADLQKEISVLKASSTQEFAEKSSLEQLASELMQLRDETSSKVEGVASAAANSVKNQVDALSGELKQLNDIIANGDAGDGAAAASLKKTQNDLAAQLSALQGELTQQVGDLKAASKDAAQDVLKQVQGSLDTLQSQFTDLKSSSQQIAELQANLGKVQAQVSEALAKIDGVAAEQKTLDAKIAAVSAELAQTNDAIAGRVTKLETAIGTASAQERAARAIAIATLRNAVDSGAPYEAELAAVKAVVASEDAELAPLQAYAATGIPSSATLIAEFGGVAREMSAVIVTEGDEDVVDRLLSSAQSLVSIRTPNESAGGSSSALLGTMEARVSAGDLSGAMTAYKELPDPVQAAGAEWAKQVQARLTADELVKKVTAQVLESLASKSE